MHTEFSERLRNAMENRKIYASELSRISGVGKSDISNYLKGKYVPKQDKCYLIAKALNVDPGWLMTGYEPSNDEESVPNNDDIRVLVKQLNNLTPQQLKQAKDVFRAMFAITNPELFDEEDANDT